MNIPYSLIIETLRYCKSHCDSAEELALVEWVEEKITEAVSHAFSAQIVARVDPYSKKA